MKTSSIFIVTLLFSSHAGFAAESHSQVSLVSNQELELKHEQVAEKISFIKTHGTQEENTKIDEEFMAYLKEGKTPQEIAEIDRVDAQTKTLNSKADLANGLGDNTNPFNLFGKLLIYVLVLQEASKLVAKLEKLAGDRLLSFWDEGGKGYELHQKIQSRVASVTK